MQLLRRGVNVTATRSVDLLMKFRPKGSRRESRDRFTVISDIVGRR